MKKLITFLSITLSALLLVCCTAPAIPSPSPNTDPIYQRYITFHNDFDFPIYPVIQVPEDLCDGADFTGVRRIIVNGPENDVSPPNKFDGLQPNETVTVLIPNESQTLKDGTIARCWYQSGRIYIFPVSLNQFEQAMVQLDPNNQPQITNYQDSNHPSVSVPCFQGKRDNPGSSGNCFTGTAVESFAADVPAQLAEYTFDSDNATNGDPDTGIPMADIDVSNVDDLYLPVAASVANHGATGYMGGAMNLTTFRQRVADFVTHLPWTVYSAYSSQYQADNAFSQLLPAQLGGTPPAAHVPGGYNSIQNSLAKSTSLVYKIKDSSTNYLISGVTNYPTQVQPYIDRWMSWINGSPCTNLDALGWPDGITAAFDKNKANFCNLFQANAQAVWGNFYTAFQKDQSAFYTDCSLTDANPDTNLQNACIIQHIVGYNPNIGGADLPPMPDRPQRVQALLRSVAYEPNGNNQQYQFDPFLTFAAPYNSQFNLDPYTRLIHSPTDGVDAVAYSFSIDDKYGNYRDAASGFIVDAGGVTALENQRPYDPYQQYKINWGYNEAGSGISNNWTSASVCDLEIPINVAGNQTMPLPFDLQANQYQPCPVKLTDSKGNSFAFSLTPVSRQVTDTYTGATVQVWGFPTGQNSGSPLTTSTLSPADLENCKQSSDVLIYGLCGNITVSAVWASDPSQRDIVYMGLDYTDMPRVNLNMPPAPDLTSGQVIWPYSATITTKAQDSDETLISWPAAVVAADQQPPLVYTLYVQQGSGWQSWCSNSSQLSCSVQTSDLGASANLYVIAINQQASPVQQSLQLFGCYPSANACSSSSRGSRSAAQSGQQ
jgi:hypothetical protein